MHGTPASLMRVGCLRWVSAVALTLLAGCASLPNDNSDEADDAAQHALREAEAAELAGSAWARASQSLGNETTGTWVHRRYGNHRPTRYQSTVHEGRVAVHASSDAGNSTLRLRLPADGQPAPARLAFSWFVPALNEKADLRDQDIDDAVVRVIVTFDGDRDRLSMRDNMLSELANLVTGEPLPFATLMYVWDHRYPVGSVIPNPHTQRIRKLVIDSGPGRLNQWVDHERDIEADYRLVFGELPGPVTAVGVMTDSNNTGERVSAWFGPLVLSPLRSDAGVAARRD
ncbi:DUF3047 domain-containing protein [Hydrogenophaga sp.]|uniref:DUF3047 domain-containing protein n=1 Tax=Hydrogenophaga sp. TaxID=1904254 RepID=UPI0025C652E6|nr:DUF3047 domain-containing protein [Hydrogenophaga sp.]MBT9463059.1 DUF3047 domain-containing protein [Hydrogenophaga sp.]